MRKRLANGDLEHGFAVVAEVTAFEVPLTLHVKVNGLQRRVKKKGNALYGLSCLLCFCKTMQKEERIRSGLGGV